MDIPVNDNLDQLADSIVQSYYADKRTHRIGAIHLPARERIVEIVEGLRELIFPGYFGRKQLTDENVRYHVGSLLIGLGQDLTDEINKCLRMSGGCDIDKCEECADPDHCRRQAADIAKRFLLRIPRIRRMLALDAQAAFDGDPAAKSVDEVIYCYPGFYAVTVYRMAHELYELGVPLMPRIMTEHAHAVTGTDIHPGAIIGESFFIDHATGVVIGETTRIGRNVKIYQGVTLGAMSFPKDERGRVIKGLQRHPTIEDDVTIYANATILGGATVIGQGAEVGGNTFLTRSVTAESTVGHEPPKLRVRAKNSE